MGSYADCAAGARELALYELLRQRLAKAVSVPDPAAGAPFSVSVPAGVVWELLGGSMRLQTSAVVATRLPALVQSDPDGRVLGAGLVQAGQAASTVVTWTFGVGAGYGSVAVATGGMMWVPSFPLISGATLAAIIGALDVSDQVSRVVLYVREWSIGDVGQQADWLESRVGSWRNR